MRESSVDDTHGELTVEVTERTHTSHEEIYVVLIYVVCQEAFDTHDFDFFTEFRGDLTQKTLTVVH